VAVPPPLIDKLSLFDNNREPLLQASTNRGVFLLAGVSTRF